MSRTQTRASVVDHGQTDEGRLGTTLERSELVRSTLTSAIRALPDELPFVEEGGAHYPDPADSIRQIFYSGAAWPDPKTLSALTLQGDVAGEFSVPSSLLCLSDFVRTKRFAAGIERAMQVVAERFPKGELYVIEAGGGALPFMSLVAATCEPRARVTIVEANSVSAALAKEAVEHAGLADRIDVICADATRWRPRQRCHVLVSETMDSGLLKEPIADIMANLAPCVTRGGLILPHEVRLEAGLAAEDVAEELRAGYLLPHGALIPAVPDEVFTASVTWRTSRRLSRVKFDLPREPDVDDSLVVRGRLTIVPAIDGRPAIELGPNESAITMASFMAGGLMAQCRDRVWSVSYRPGRALLFME